MGGQCSVLQGLKKKLFGNKEVRILITGLDAAGKTTVLYQLKLGEIVTTIPTIGFNVETIEYKGVSFTSWDVGGRDGTRKLLKHYYPNTDAFMLIVDSGDRDRIEQSRDLVWEIIHETEDQNSVFLIMANKQDLPNAMSIDEITDKLELEKITDRSWHIQPSCATSGDGLYNGLDWLHTQLTGEAVKKSVMKPIQETKDSVTKQSTLSSWFNSLSSYWKTNSVVQ